ncbi:hypothetical protein AGMMS49921_06440 [Endomicrobiia bacterium]|nr:hypothetical protein AGMMS49921_06440 [Endomicrobiia bacterium]
MVYGGWTRNGTASGNKVFIKNKVTISKYVRGGYSDKHGDAKIMRLQTLVQLLAEMFMAVLLTK